MSSPEALRAAWERAVRCPACGRRSIPAVGYVLTEKGKQVLKELKA